MLSMLSVLPFADDAHKSRLVGSRLERTGSLRRPSSPHLVIELTQHVHFGDIPKVDGARFGRLSVLV